MPQPGMGLEANDIPLANHASSVIPDTNPIVQVSRDEALHGEDEENNENVVSESSHEDITIPRKVSVLPKVKFAVVSALGRHETQVTSRDAFGKEVARTLKSKDVFEIEQRDFAERRLTESKNKWDPKALEGLNGWQKFGKKAERFFDRVWRGMGAEDAHRAKEKALGAELSGVVGIDTAISEEFNAVLDKEARKRVDSERQTKSQKFFGGVKDAWAEFTGTRRDLHKYELVVAQELRQKYDADPTNPDPTENPLYSLINRDVAAREALAARVNESDLELLKQTNQGDKKTAESIKLEGREGKKVEEFLKKEIIGKAIDDFTARTEAGTHVTGIDGKLRRDLDLKLQDYFMTDEFDAWRKTLPAEQQAMFENSFTYASDILLQTEEVILPNVLENLDHYKSDAKLDFDMELSLGTAQLSANTEATKDDFIPKERASLNQKLMDQLRTDRNTTEHSRIYDSAAINSGLKHERLMGYVSMIAKNEAVEAWVGAATFKGIATVARGGMSWLPGVGSGLVAGTLSGFKEWGRMGKNRATFGYGTANGLEFPIADKAVKSAELRAADYHRIQFGPRTQQFLEANAKFKDGTADANTAFITMVNIADSGARLKLNGERNINLLTASIDGPEGRGIFARELRVHDKARAIAKESLTKAFANESISNEVADIMGIPADQPRDLDVLLAKIEDIQYQNLLSGVQVSGALKAAITNVNPELIRQESESIQVRDKIFNGMRWNSTVKHGVTSGVIAGVAGWGLGKFFHHTEALAGTENHTVVLVDHALPSHQDLLPTAQITDDHGNLLAETHSWLPSGTHLELIQHRVGGPDDIEHSYNLVTDNTKNDVLLHGIVFGNHGEIQNQAQLLAEETKNHITITPHELSPVSWGSEGSTIDSSGWHNSIIWGEQPGMSQGGPDGWIAHNLSVHHTPDGVERVTEISGVKQVWKGLEDDLKNANMHINQIAGYSRQVHYIQSINGPQALSTPQSDILEITNLPNLLGTAAGHDKLAGLVDESVKMHAALAPGQQLDRLHQVVWEASYWGDEAHVPHGADLKLILDWAGENTPGTAHSVIPVDNYFTMDQDLTTFVPVHTGDVYTQGVADMWTHLAAAGYSHPLEAPIVKQADSQASTTTTSVPPSQVARENQDTPSPENRNESTIEHRLTNELVDGELNNGLHIPRLDQKSNEDLVEDNDRVREYGQDEREAMMLDINDDGSNPGDKQKTNEKNKKKLSDTTAEGQTSTEIPVSNLNSLTKNLNPNSPTPTTTPVKSTIKKSDEKIKTNSELKQESKNIEQKDLDLENTNSDINSGEPLIESADQLSEDERKNLKDKLKTKIDILQDNNLSTLRNSEISLLDAENEVKTHLLEGQSLADFATLEYGAIRDAIHNLSDNQLKEIFKAMENRPDLQAVYHAAMIGLRTLPSNYENHTKGYKARIFGAEKRIAELESQLKVVESKRLASIFDQDFKQKFNGTLQWGEPTVIKHNYDAGELQNGAKGILTIPEQAVFNQEDYAEIINQKKTSLNNITEKVKFDPTTETVESSLNRQINQIEALRTSLAPPDYAKLTAKNTPYSRLKAKKSNFKKLTKEIDYLESASDKFTNSSDRTLPVEFYSMGIGNRGLVAINKEFLSCFRLDGAQLDEEYVFGGNAQVDWSASGKATETVLESRDLHIEWDELATDEKTPRVHKMADLHFEEDGRTPDSDSLEKLKNAGFWDEKLGTNKVESNNRNELVNRSPEEIIKTQEAIVNQKQVIKQYENLINKIGDRKTPGTFAYRISQATSELDDVLYERSQTLKDIVDPVGYPIAYSAIGNESLTSFIEGTDQVTLDDMLLGALLIGNKAFVESLPVGILNAVAKLRKQVNIDDLAVLQYYRSDEQPADLNDKNRVQVYKREFTRGNAINFVFKDNIKHYNKVGITRPYDLKENVRKAANYYQS